MNNLSVLEFEDIVTLDDVAIVIQRTEMVMRIVAEIDRYICELGNEGRLISMQIEELLSNIEEDGLLVIDDYIVQTDNRTSESVMRQIRFLKYEELMELTIYLSAFGLL